MSQITSSAQASAQVNGIAGNTEWRRHAAAMLGHTDKASYAGCKFIVGTVNRAIEEGNMDAVEWLRRAIASKTAAVRNTSKLCVKIMTACLYGVQEVDKKGLSVTDAPEIKDWTAATIKEAANTHNWKERKGAVLSFWTGKAPIRIKKSRAQRTPAERLEAIAKAAAALMAKEGITMSEVTAAISKARADYIVK
jgi:hypothetical protein